MKERRTIKLPVKLLCRQYAPLRNELDVDNGQSFYQSINVDINPKKTAIVVIDVWDDEYIYGRTLNELVRYKLNPMLELARNNNITIVHAPSIINPGNVHNINHLLSKEPTDIIAQGYDNFDDELSARGIDTLLYVGYDALLCVLDKPCGLFNTKRRSNKYRMIVVRDCVTSHSEEMRQIAINMVETSFGYSTSLGDLYSSLETTPSQGANYHIYPIDYSFRPKETALVVVGAIKDHPRKDWLNRVAENLKGKLVPLVEFARKKGLKIIHAPNGDNIADDCRPLPGEEVIYSEEEFNRILRSGDTKNLLYSGYALNDEVLFGPAGITRLYIKNRYHNDRLAIYYIVSDCTLAFSTCETLSEKTIKQTLLQHYRLMEPLRSEQLPKMLRE